MRRRRLSPPVDLHGTAFAGFRFPPDVIVLSVRWYLRFNLSYRDLEELLAERGVEVDHVTLYRWVQRFTPLLAEAARPCRGAVASVGRRARGGWGDLASRSNGGREFVACRGQPELWVAGKDTEFVEPAA